MAEYTDKELYTALAKDLMFDLDLEIPEDEKQFTKTVHLAIQYRTQDLLDNKDYMARNFDPFCQKVCEFTHFSDYEVETYKVPGKKQKWTRTTFYK